MHFLSHLIIKIFRGIQGGNNNTKGFRKDRVLTKIFMLRENLCTYQSEGIANEMRHLEIVDRRLIYLFDSSLKVGIVGKS